MYDIVQLVKLNNKKDKWWWDIGNSGTFPVGETRRWIDDKFFKLMIHKLVGISLFLGR